MAGSSALPSDFSAETRRVIIAAILTISVVGVGLSMTIPLLSLELERMGASPLVNGLSTAVGGIGNIFIAPLVPWLSGRMGQKRFLAVAVLILAASVLALWLLRSIPAWFVLRFVFGAAIGVLFVMSEFWITASAPEAQRGIIMGIYATVLALGFAAGPALLSLTGTSGFAPYVACAGLIVLALLPVYVAPARVPPIEGTPHLSVLTLVKVAPIATLAALVFGAIETGMFNQLPLYGIRLGLDDRQAALLVTVAALGNLALQVPIGALSDRMDRRMVLWSCAIIGMLGLILMPSLDPKGWTFLFLLFSWGGVVGAIYTVGLAHLGSRFPASEVAAANAVFVMLYSFGMIVGPPIAGAAMDQIGPAGFPLSLAAMLGAYALLIGWRMARLRL
jgi:MFS family permease